MNGLKIMLMQEQKHLETVINKAKNALENAPEGRLRISKGKNKPRFYHCVDDRDGTYIQKKDVKLIPLLAQKTYNLDVLNIAEKRFKQISKMLADYSDREIEEVYTSMTEDRRKLIIPVEPTWQQIIDHWLSIPYQGKAFGDNVPLIMTNRGERVRSKSEKILADFFYQNNIPYKYECPIYLKGYGVVYPDFTFLSRKTGKEIYWEHEGRMDDPDYARKAVKKIERYQANDLLVGERLILTYETSNCVLNMDTVCKTVKQFLL